MKKSNIIVCKFGGSSVASACGIKKIKALINKNQNRRVIVVSAPGKTNKYHTKITDALLKAYLNPEEYYNCIEYVKNRFFELKESLCIDFDLDYEFNKIDKQFKMFKSKSYLLSRGEYIMAKMVAIYLDYNFVDSAKIIKFNTKGKLLKLSYRKINNAIDKNYCIVVPGFYGSNILGKIKVMSRGGSDITGSIIASAINANTYENWTDVDGVLEASPDILNSAEIIKSISYDDMQMLSFYGAGVLHHKCSKFSQKHNTLLRNTFTNGKVCTKVQQNCRKNINAITKTNGIQFEFCKNYKKVLKLVEKSKCEVLYKFIDNQRLIMGLRTTEGFVCEKYLNMLQKYTNKTTKVKVFLIIGDVRKYIDVLQKENDNFILCSKNKNKYIIVFKLFD